MTAQNGLKAIDIHSHWSTRRGYPLQTEAELALQERAWRSTQEYRSEAEMAEDFRRARVRVILDFGYTKYLGASARQGIYHILRAATRLRAICRSGAFPAFHDRLACFQILVSFARIHYLHRIEFPGLIIVHPNEPRIAAIQDDRADAASFSIGDRASFGTNSCATILAL
jgi:hypothetical protein